MGRPHKRGIDYFPHSVVQGKTIYILEQLYGNDGYAFWFKLLELLGASRQHVYDCNNPHDWMFLLAKTRVDEVTANKILDTLAQLDAIDPELWQQRVVWSQNFVDGLAAYYKRRGADLPAKTELLHAETPQRGSYCTQKPRNAGISGTNTCNNSVKEEKRRGFRGGEEKIKATTCVSPDGDTCPRPAADTPPVTLSDETPTDGVDTAAAAHASTNGDCPHKEIIALYHEVLPHAPRVREWPAHREKLLRARWKEKPERQDLAWWRRFFEGVAASAFLTGKTERGFLADLEWLIRPTNFVKVMEGRYANRAGPRDSPQADRPKEKWELALEGKA